MAGRCSGSLYGLVYLRTARLSPDGSRDAPNPGHAYAHAYGSGLTLSLWPLHARKCNGHHSIYTPLFAHNLHPAALWGRPTNA